MLYFLSFWDPCCIHFRHTGVCIRISGRASNITHSRGAVNKVMTETDRTHALVRSTSLQPSKKDGSLTNEHASDSSGLEWRQ